jgi:hypothetical protein
MTGAYDEALLRFQATGPERRGWLSNHGPMAVDALARIDHAAEIGHWVDGYLPQLEEPPAPRWPISPTEWRDPLGDPSRLGDWLTFFDRQLKEDPWPDVLAVWWPRLLPGAIASATHALIRTGHVVRSLLEEVTEPRVQELGQALGYWAARWAPLPVSRPEGDLAPGSALAGVPSVPDRGGARSRIAALAEQGDWPRAASLAHAPDTALLVEVALDGLVDAAVTRYAFWAAAEPIMLVHMATAPRAARLVLPALPASQWVSTYAAAWNVSAAIASMYRPSGSDARPAVSPSDDDSAEAVAFAAAENGDEHAIKFAEVAIESHRRGNANALPAARAALELIGRPALSWCARPENSGGSAAPAEDKTQADQGRRH